MNREEQYGSLAETRSLLLSLRGLDDVVAPAHVLPAVLLKSGVGDAYWQQETPLGPTYIAYNRLGLSALMPAESAHGFEQAFRSRFGRPAARIDAPPPRLQRVVDARLRGERRGTLHVDLRGMSPFEQAVLMKALEIPFGEVRPYAWVAREIGSPGATRAVGSALGNNPIPLVIPCHRVIRSDGSVGEYGLGRDAKVTMLSYEGIDPAWLAELKQAGVRYVGSDTTHIYCLPTCHRAQRISEQHRVPFASPASAAAAGYRACLICRPA